MPTSRTAYTNMTGVVSELGLPGFDNDNDADQGLYTL